MKKIYTSNGAGDVLYCLDDYCKTTLEVVVETGSVPKAILWAGLLQDAYDRGRQSMADDFRALVGLKSS